MLTDDELKAIDLLADFYTLCNNKIVGKQVPEDMQEIVHHIHILQRTIMKQAAARQYPDKFRLLGKNHNENKNSI